MESLWQPLKMKKPKKEELDIKFSVIICSGCLCVETNLLLNFENPMDLLLFVQRLHKPMHLDLIPERQQCMAAPHIVYLCASEFV